MNTDYRTPITYYSDPRTFVLKRKLGNDGLAALNFLWCWTAIHKANGILTGLSEDWIEAVSFWDGEHGKFVPTLLELEYLDQLEDGTYAIHNWAETNHWAAEAETRENKSRFSNMARFYPELYEELSAQGVTGISRSDFVRLTAEYDRRGILDTSSASSKKCVAYAPTPTPSPAPTPTPVPVPSTTPIPSPFRPFRTPEPESVSGKTPKKTRKVGAKAPASTSSSSFKEKECMEILSQNPQAESAAQAEPVISTESAAQAESKDSTINAEKILVQDEKHPQQTKARIEGMDTPEVTKAESATSTTPPEQTTSTEQYILNDAVEATIIDILTQWNLQLARLGFPQVLRSTARREAAFKARVHASQERIYLTWWVALFDKIAASDFMCESARQKANWLTLDWVLKEQNMMKILEGKYDSERPVTAEIHNRTFRGRHFSDGKKETMQDTSTQNVNVQDTPQQGASTGGISEESLRRINEARASLGKPPLSNDTCIAECSEPGIEPEAVTALPEEIERDIPDEDNFNAEDTGYTYTTEELADYYATLDEYRAEQATQQAASEETPEEELDDSMQAEAYESYEQELEAIRREQEEYEASMKGVDDYYVNE